MQPIRAYIMGRIKLGTTLAKKDPESQSKFLLKTFKEIKEVNIITGEWDLMIEFAVPSMEQYYHVAWGIAKHLDRGWGTLVAKSVSR